MQFLTCLCLVKGLGLQENKDIGCSPSLTWNISLERHTEKIPATPDLIYHSVSTAARQHKYGMCDCKGTGMNTNRIYNHLYTHTHLLINI